MKISKDEILHIANLANLNIADNEIEKYMLHLQDILNFANIVNDIPTDGILESVSSNDSSNIFREDTVIPFEDRDILLQNAPMQDNGMFKIPKVI